MVRGGMIREHDWVSPTSWNSPPNQRAKRSLDKCPNVIIRWGSSRYGSQIADSLTPHRSSAHRSPLIRSPFTANRPPLPKYWNIITAHVSLAARTMSVIVFLLQNSLFGLYFLLAKQPSFSDFSFLISPFSPHMSSIVSRQFVFSAVCMDGQERWNKILLYIYILLIILYYIFLYSYIYIINILLGCNKGDSSIPCFLTDDWRLTTASGMEH